MDNELTNLPELSPEIQEEIKKTKFRYKIGDIFIYRHGGYYRLSGFRMKQYYKRNENNEPVPNFKVLEVGFVQISGDKDRQLWHEYTEFERNPSLVKITGTPEEAEKEAIDWFINGAKEEVPDVQESKSLTTSSYGSNELESIEKELASKKEHMDSMLTILELKKRALDHLKYQLSEQLGYVSRIVRMFEVYLGYYEDITQIREGKAAGGDTPITIRQLVLYMDEEVGDIEYRDGQLGIDFRRIEDFDAWIAEHYEIAIPEEKGIIAFKISRQQREYAKNPIENFFIASENDKAYLLIRNGENLYRIYGALKMKQFLFPSVEEYNKIVEEMSKYGEDRPPMRVLNDEMDWREQAIFIQGLLERTEILKPYKIPNVNLFEPETFEQNAVVMLRDGDTLNLPDGRLPYEQWKKEINSKIERGSRIVVSKYYRTYGDSADYNYQYFDGRYSRRSQLPNFPAAGIYVVADAKVDEGRYAKEGEKKLKFLYTPGDEIWVRDEYGYIDARERKYRTSFHISNTDQEVLNYDEISLEDVQYYISNRVDRRNYLNMLPALYKVRDIRLAEIEQEKHFVKLITNELECEEKLVWECVEWWKLKNIWKRPLSEDDAKAWRMIRKEIKKRMK